MTDHRIRIAIIPEGVLCSICDQPVQWVRPEYSTHVGRWQHVEPDPVALAASMARHPAKGGGSNGAKLAGNAQ